MKRLLLLSMLFGVLICNGQEAQHVFVSLNKTVHMFFPSEIKYTDVGSKDVLFETTGTILKLAAAVSNFAQTNITVITKDEVCYSFIVGYKEDVSELIYYISGQSGKRLGPTNQDIDSVVQSFEDSRKILSETDTLKILCEKAVKKPFVWWDEGAICKKVYFALNNIFVSNDKLFFVVSVGNHSNINYDVDYLKLIICDKKRLKRSSIQDIEKHPVYVYQKPNDIKGNTKVHTFVIVFEKFTIPDKKKAVFETGEKNGGRSIQYDLKKDLIVEADLLRSLLHNFE
jgi:conjugative transposon TraN protein